MNEPCYDQSCKLKHNGQLQHTQPNPHDRSELANEALAIYYAVQHILGECNADSHMCNYDSSLSLPEQNKKIGEVYRVFQTARDRQHKERLLAAVGKLSRHYGDDTYTILAIPTEELRLAIQVEFGGEEQ